MGPVNLGDSNQSVRLSLVTSEWTIHLRVAADSVILAKCSGFEVECAIPVVCLLGHVCLIIVYLL